MDWLAVLNLVDSTLRLSAPLVFAALAGLYSERSGVFDIGLEGKMLASAFTAAAVAAVSGSATLALLAGIGVAVVFSLIHGLASITYRGNQIVSGVALNFVASGLTIILGAAWFGLGGGTPNLPAEARFLPIDLPGAEAARAIPVLGPIYAEVVSGQNLLLYLAVLAVPLTWWVLYRTRFGLRLRAVGENPGAVDTAGISVTWLRYRAVIICGVLTGLAGAYLSIAQSAAFSREMTAGRGYIALAALIFANWKPVPVLFACLLFGFLDALSIRLQTTALPLVGQIPPQFVQALPYILTVILLAGFVGKASPPRAGGVPYVKER
ncbi:ABC transporter permease [Aureimonas jatrophae]|uniref:Nucleoside ABC transporter membrane protein n=1 Tax=Aureimonas jatrophae TaxID=1166073 RepID=A0A1H0LSY6_9HYPH|nr:ABC transporter permease [Aureimonas jatrophae]MBB3952733.1 simple sugar transport system permease protein [Aureimonas jatrophae]SDO71287.1 nucleoside ABC transporter membrane protein [Aureimonas jatrophae]